MDWPGTMTAVMLVVGWFLISSSLLVNSSFLVLTALAVPDLLSCRGRLDPTGYDESFGEPLPPGISVLIPAFNESGGIVESVRAMTAMRYPDFEVVVIDDGSTDDTAAVLVAAFDMVEVPIVIPSRIETLGPVAATYVSRTGTHNVVMVRKGHGGRADALNVGVNAARKPLMCLVNADSVLEPDTLLHVSRPFADDPEKVLACGGAVRIANGSTIRRGQAVSVRMPGRRLSRIQVVECLRGLVIGRGWSRVGGLLNLSGAFGVFRKDILFQLGGLSVDCVDEDAELVVRLHRWLGDHDVDGRVVFASEAVAWKQVPEDRATLRRTRHRGHRGLAEILFAHKAMIFRPRYGVIGMLSMPWVVAVELVAPFLEILGVAFLLAVLVLLGVQELGWSGGGLVDPVLVGILLCASLFYSVVLSLAALLAEEISFGRDRGVRDQAVAIWASVEESCGYRQMSGWWRIGGAVEAWRNARRDQAGPHRAGE